MSFYDVCVCVCAFSLSPPSCPFAWTFMPFQTVRLRKTAGPDAHLSSSSVWFQVLYVLGQLWILFSSELKFLLIKIISFFSIGSIWLVGIFLVCLITNEQVFGFIAFSFRVSAIFYIDAIWFPLTKLQTHDCRWCLMLSDNHWLNKGSIGAHANDLLNKFCLIIVLIFNNN